MDTIRRLVAENAEFLTNCRRELHRIPELAFEEVKTSAFVAETLREIGYTPRTGIARTGVMATLDTGREGPCVLLRADMDALPVTECADVDYCSTHEGCMHACGHDTHMAMLLTAAKVLLECKDQLRGVVKFVFQPAEEYPGGALPMIQEGVMTAPDVDYAFGCHIWPGAPEGTVEVKSGPLMAAMDRFDITILGQGGHAAKPHECVDALETATQVVGAMQRIISRKIDPLKAALLTVGEFHSGHTFNVIPGEATLSGTLRTFDKDVRAIWETRLREVVGGTCAAMGAGYDMTFTSGYPPVINDDEMAALIRECAAETVGEENVREPVPTMGGEDMAYFLERAKGCFFFIGSGFEGCKPIHNPGFSVNESVLPAGTEVFCRAVFKLLGA